MTKAQSNDISVCRYFVPKSMRHILITPSDERMFREWSEKGMHRDKVGTYVMDGFNALVQGKEWRGVMMGEWEQGVLDGSNPYFTLLGGFCGKRTKWWQFWRKWHEPIPDNVASFMSREMFKGADSELIMRLHRSIKSNEKGN